MLKVGPELSSNLSRIGELQREVKKLHVNLGHPSRSDFLKLLRIAGAREDVLSYV